MTEVTAGRATETGAGASDRTANGATGTGAEAVRAGTSRAAHTDAASEDADHTRLLFRYLSGEEWREYRAILAVFADTFFAEFTPEEVAARTLIDVDVARDRLESLRRWGNLTVSSSVGRPASIDDYYRRRNLYLITRSGQEVFEMVERVLIAAAADEIIDPQAGRLREMRRALDSLNEQADAGIDPAADDLADAVRAVFDVHERFTSELTQFFAQLNEWQSRYDLNPEEVHVFASVLVDYLSGQLTEIERMARPIGRGLERVLARLEELLPALRSGLAARVDEAGLSDSVTVRSPKGTTEQDWQHLAAWFLAAAGRPSRLDQHTRQALAAVRTLTTNVSRLARLGAGTASRRSDFVRLAGFFDRASSVKDAHEIAAAAFGLGSCRRLGTLSSDADDPDPTLTPWREASRASVPVSLRERGDISARGAASPIRDRRAELDELKQRRARQRVARERMAAELLSCADDAGLIDGAELSREAFSMLRDLISRSSHGARPGAEARHADDSGVRCEVRRAGGACTAVESPEGRLVMHGLIVAIRPLVESDAAA